jgi:hypothetical protein
VKISRTILKMDSLVTTPEFPQEQWDQLLDDCLLPSRGILHPTKEELSTWIQKIHTLQNKLRSMEKLAEAHAHQVFLVQAAKKPKAQYKLIPYQEYCLFDMGRKKPCRRFYLKEDEYIQVFEHVNRWNREHIDSFKFHPGSMYFELNFLTSQSYEDIYPWFEDLMKAVPLLGCEIMSHNRVGLVKLFVSNTSSDK